jgi:hypothetical protein
MSSREQYLKQPGQFSNKDFYDRAIAALLRKQAGKGHHDGFRVTGKLVHTPQTEAGTWMLTDKYTYESAAYNLAVNTDVSAAEQRRLQQVGKSVLYLQLKDQRQQSLGYYHAFWPHELRAGSELYERVIVNYPEYETELVLEPNADDLDIYFADEVTDPFPQAIWTADQPHIYHEQSIGAAHVVRAITDAHSDPYLGQIYTELLVR